MMEAEVISVEELFFEQNFEPSDDKDVIKQNLAKAEMLYQKAQLEVSKIAEELEDGVCFDKCEGILAVQTLGLSERFIERYRQLLQEEEMVQ